MADMDIEAMNRLRVAMGMKPIEVPGASGPDFRPASHGKDGEDAASTLETRSAAAEDNYRKAQEEAQAKAKRIAQKEAIKKARDAAMRETKLTGKTLGDPDQDLDTATWLRQQTKRQKKIDKARRLEEELAAREEQAEYTAKDLAGVKVGHELNDFETGAEQILTLKDAEIGEESEDDELENVDMRDDEKLKERLELKKRKPVYDPNDDGESAERGVLSHYDEEINGKQNQHFTLDGFGSTKEQASQIASDSAQKSKGIVISLDILKDEKPVSDYVETTEVKIRKSKKKKTKSTRKKNVEDDDIFPAANTTNDVEFNGAGLSRPNKRSFDHANLVDDDDLQARLAQQRREALKKKKRMRPEDLARQLREEEESTMDGIIESTEDGPGLILDETSEFVSHLEAPEDREEQTDRQRPRQQRRKSESSGAGSPDVDVEMQETDLALTKEQSPSLLPQNDNNRGVMGLEEEAAIDRGVGSILSMLRQRKQVVDNEFGQCAKPLGEQHQRGQIIRYEPALQTMNSFSVGPHLRNCTNVHCGPLTTFLIHEGQPLPVPLRTSIHHGGMANPGWRQWALPVEQIQD